MLTPQSIYYIMYNYKFLQLIVYSRLHKNDLDNSTAQIINMFYWIIHVSALTKAQASHFRFWTLQNPGLVYCYCTVSVLL